MKDQQAYLVDLLQMSHDGLDYQRSFLHQKNILGIANLKKERRKHAREGRCGHLIHRGMLGDEVEEGEERQEQHTVRRRKFIDNNLNFFEIPYKIPVAKLQVHTAKGRGRRTKRINDAILEASRDEAAWQIRKELLQ